MRSTPGSIPRRLPPPGRMVLPLLAAAILAIALSDLTAGTGKCAGRESDPDCALYVIARKCIDTEAADYCRICPRPRTSYCPEARSCDQTTEVWAGGQRYVALRDASMCACPQVMHGIVLPFGAVSGIEDPDRPPTIWKFSWDVAVSTGLDPDQIALIVSSPEHRTQSQLHVHILPLDKYHRASLEATPSVEVADLYNVWTKADALAASKGIKVYGVLVHHVGAGWHVHVENVALTDAYTTLPECQRDTKKR
jgi:CDP-diacylglycerol pyrophosphatase